MMGLEEHLLTMFRGDFEFHEGAAASHLGRTAPAAPLQPVARVDAPAVSGTAAPAAVAAPVVAEAAPTELAPPRADIPIAPARPATPVAPTAAAWAVDAERELQKIPFFVRGKARRNTERFALERGVALITVETLYDAKAHFSR
jgi:light-independent protochlorophyllide reductase subunit B